MKKTIIFLKKNIVTIVLVTGLSFVWAAPGYALTQAATDACDGIEAAGGDCDPGADGSQFRGLVITIIDILSIVVGAASVIMIIVGGFRYVISGGDSNGIQGAKNTIIYALVGLVIVLFAQVIVRFVIKQSITTLEPSSSESSRPDPSATNGISN